VQEFGLLRVLTTHMQRALSRVVIIFCDHRFGLNVKHLLADLPFQTPVFIRDHLTRCMSLSSMSPTSPSNGSKSAGMACVRHRWPTFRGGLAFPARSFRICTWVDLRRSSRCSGERTTLNLRRTDYVEQVVGPSVRTPFMFHGLRVNHCYGEVLRLIGRNVGARIVHPCAQSGGRR
jgi:hypothetical protein